MRILYIGSVQFSLDVLKELILREANVVGVCTKTLPIEPTDHVDLMEFCHENAIECRHFTDLNSTEAILWVDSLAPDVVFCFGWPQLLGEKFLAVAPKGVVGFHPAEIPSNRGRHPIIWALALGLKQTASTFFLMDVNPDSGPILSQEIVPISENDYAKDLYEKITQVAIRQIGTLLHLLETGQTNPQPQELTHSNLWRKRDRKDGEIDWRMSADKILDLVRALAKPYPGAHFVFKGEDVKVWKAEKVEIDACNIEPGKVLSINGCLVVKCGDYGLKLISVEPAIDLKEGLYL